MSHYCSGSYSIPRSRDAAQNASEQKSTVFMLYRSILMQHSLLRCAYCSQFTINTVSIITRVICLFFRRNLASYLHPSYYILKTNNDPSPVVGVTSHASLQKRAWNKLNNDDLELSFLTNQFHEGHRCFTQRSRSLSREQIDKSDYSRYFMQVPKRNFQLLLGVVMLCFNCIFMLNTSVLAKELTIRPGISLQELYTDNINLSLDGEEEGAFVTEVSPYVTIKARGARNRINAALRLENLFFHGINKNSNTFFQGQLESRSRLWANSFFVDLRGTHTQANTRNRGRIATDNISQSGNRVDVSTYTISPFWRIHLGGYAEGEARVSYSNVMVSNNDDNRSNIADSRIHEEKFTLNSAHKFDVIGWKLGLSNRDENRQSGNVNDIHYFNAFGEINFKVVSRFIMFVRAGYADNDLGLFQLNSKNGVYYQAGARWRPSNGLELSGAAGNNNFIHLSMIPFQRAKWQVGYRHNKIGLNTGSQWDTNFEYKMNHLVWRAGYEVDTVTTQQVLLERDVFDSGFVSNNNSSGLTVDNSQNDLTFLSNEVFERKRGEVSVQGNTGKNTLRLTGYTEQRNFDSNRRNEEANGALLSWRWHFDGRTSSVMTTDIEHIDGGNLQSDFDEKNIRWGIGIQIRRALSKYLTATFGYRYSRQESNQSESEYTENRVFGRVNYIYQ